MAKDWDEGLRTELLSECFVVFHHALFGMSFRFALIVYSFLTFTLTFLGTSYQILHLFFGST